jgi:hypothetical protein
MGKEKAVALGLLGDANKVGFTHWTGS